MVAPLSHRESVRAGMVGRLAPSIGGYPGTMRGMGAD